MVMVTNMKTTTNSRPEQKDYVDKLVATSNLTAPAAAWMRVALDPFHDFQVHDLQGLPDSATSQVICERVVQTLSVTNAGTGSALWDMHVSTLPEGFPFSAVTNAYSDANGGSFQAGSAMNNLGMLSVVATATGQPTFPTSTSTVNNTAWYNLNPPLGLINGKRRCLGWGFEIVDTTPQLYRGGTVTVYQVPQSCDLHEGPVFGPSQTLATSSNSNVYISSAPPSLLSEAIAYPGSRQWAGEQGAYIVVPQDVTRNQLSQTERRMHFFVRGDNVGNSDGATGFGNFSSTLFAASTQQNHFSNPPCFPLPFHTRGAFFSGLQPQATYTITMRTYWEFEPQLFDTNSSTLVYLAAPSCPNDPLALELYSRAATLCPIGCPVGDNASGDFWDWVLGAIKTVAPAVGGLLMPGAGSAVGSAVSQWAGNFQKNRNEKDKVTEKAMQRMARPPDLQSNNGRQNQDKSKNVAQVKTKNKKKKNKDLLVEWNSS